MITKIVAKKNLKQAVEKHLISRIVETKTAEEKGKFLPLSVRERKGYDIAMIQAKNIPTPLQTIAMHAHGLVQLVLLL